MAKVQSNLWHRNKFKLTGLLLILPFYFLYQSLNPVFPDAWQVKQIGEFEVSPMPYNLEKPYLHDGHFTKDFFITFSKGKVNGIRQAYFYINAEPLSLTVLEKGDAGILHGSQHGQEVHAISPKIIKPHDKAWLTIQTWSGEQLETSWTLPVSFTK